MQTTIRTFGAAGLAAAMLFSMGACGAGGDSAGGSDYTGGVKDDGVVKFMMADDQNGAFADAAKTYEQETGVKVEVSEVAYSDLRTKLANGAQANDLPDTARVDQLNPVWSDQLVDLTDLASSAKVLDNMVVKNSDNKVLTLPSDLTAVGLFINKSLFDQAGVSYPTDESNIWTWDEFIDAIKQVKAKTGAKYGMVMDASTHRERAMMYQFGSQDVQQVGDEWKLDQGAKDALEYLNKINDDDIMPRSVWLSKDDPSALFKSGQVAAYYSGNWQIADFVNSITDFEWQAVYMPYQTTRATNLGNGWMVAFSAEGKKFLDWFYQSDNYKAFCEQGSYLPAVNDLTPEYSQRNEDFQIFNDEIAASDPISSHQNVSQLEMALKGAILSEDPMKLETVKYLSGEEDVDTAISNMEAGFTKYYSDTDE